MDRCDLSLTEGELIVLRMLTSKQIIPANRQRALNSLAQKAKAASLKRSKLRLVPVPIGKVAP